MLIASLITRRHELGLTQLDLDDHLGTTIGQVAKWESGARRPSSPQLCLWAAGLNSVVGIVARTAPMQLADLAQRRPWRVNRLGVRRGRGVDL